MSGPKVVRVYLPPPLAAASEAISKETGISESELLREAFGVYLLVRQGLKRDSLRKQG